MATLSITVDDAIVPRIQAAYGVANNAALKAAIIADIKKKVVDYEVGITDSMQSANVTLAVDAKRIAIETAKTTAESEITIT